MLFGSTCLDALDVQLIDCLCPIICRTGVLNRRFVRERSGTKCLKGLP
ncbi:hypothetical protein PAMC26577_35420 [Caballeronia sordidicola]|uniref:Uncharacterized protein n=1 Tax=Caballeronia sordidicola TaxID=196367 RepID=A0A2C9XX59_CABSO|nr:hypothetical protein PAMC26577_35420 [Caballeronia sordidicola]